LSQANLQSLLFTPSWARQTYGLYSLRLLEPGKLTVFTLYAFLSQANLQSLLSMPSWARQTYSLYSLCLLEPGKLTVFTLFEPGKLTVFTLYEPGKLTVFNLYAFLSQANLHSLLSMPSWVKVSFLNEPGKLTVFTLYAFLSQVNLQSLLSMPSWDLRNQVTFGWGTPVALQRNVTLRPSSTSTSRLDSWFKMYDGTETALYHWC